MHKLKKINCWFIELLGDSIGKQTCATCLVSRVQFNSYDTVYMSAEQKKEEKNKSFAAKTYSNYLRTHIGHPSFMHHFIIIIIVISHIAADVAGCPFLFPLSFSPRECRISLHNCYNSKYLLVVKILRMDLMGNETENDVRWRKRKRRRRSNMKWEQYCGLGNK